MATDCTQDSVLQFLMEKGGRVKNVELVDHFKSFFTNDPTKKTLVKEAFKVYVDNVAFVKVENGVKFVCLKKKYRGSAKRSEEKADGECNVNGIAAGNVSALKPSERTLNSSAVNGHVYGIGVDNLQSKEENYINPASNVTLTGYTVVDRHGLKTAPIDVTVKQIPGSDYKTDKEHGMESDTSAENLEIKPTTTTPEYSAASAAPTVRVSCENTSLKTGYTIKTNSQGATVGGYDSSCANGHNSPEFGLPEIVRVKAYSLPTVDGGSALPDKNLRLNDQPDQESTPGNWNQTTSQNHLARERDVESTAKAYEEDGELGACRGMSMVQLITRRRASRGSQRSLLSSSQSLDGTDEGHLDSVSASGNDSNTPKGSRKNFIELMMNSSPQVRRSMVHRNSGHPSVRQRDPVRSDSDSTSLVSSIEDDGGSVMLDPLEHEWMMCSSDGQWESLHRLLACEPNLVVKKDFVTGFTCLHWAAKQGKHELLALLVNFGKQHGVPLNINVRSSAGYTPLHLAAMHNRLEVVKLLVGAYDADVEVRDYSGKKASQYLTRSVSEDIRDIIGAGGDSDAENVESGAGRWRLSNLMPLKLLNPLEEDVCDGGALVKTKSVYRKSSINRMKPRLQKIRFRTQIVHSTSFREADEGENNAKSPLKSRPKSNLFG